MHPQQWAELLSKSFKSFHVIIMFPDSQSYISRCRNELVQFIKELLFCIGNSRLHYFVLYIPSSI